MFRIFLDSNCAFAHGDGVTYFLVGAVNGTIQPTVQAIRAVNSGAIARIAKAFAQEATGAAPAVRQSPNYQEA